MERLLNRFFFIVLPIILGLTLTFSYLSSQQGIQTGEAIKKQNEQLIAISEQQKNDLNTLRKDNENLRSTLLCIGMFFNYTNRTNLSIKSYNPCQIENTETGEVTEIPLGSGTETGEPSSAPAQNPVDNNSRTVPSSNNTPPQQPPQSESSQNPSDNLPPSVQPNLLERAVNGTINTVRDILGL